MYKHHQGYYWKNGKPYGEGVVNAAETPVSYKIIIDPYFRRFSVEKYHFETWTTVVYDSILLDFRRLATEQTGWRREVLEEGEKSSVNLLRDQDDRTVVIERLSFTNDLCRQCEISSVLGVPVATHQMYYIHLGDHFNGVVLFDLERRPVMLKTYEWDEENCQFTNLLSEVWDMHTQPQLLRGCVLADDLLIT